MRNKLFFSLFYVIFITSESFGDTTSVATDSDIKSFIPPSQGPLGIDANTGLALYGVVILFVVLLIALWRKNIISTRSTRD